MSQPESIALSALLEEVKDTLKQNLAASRWITAEIMELQVNQRGHCYLDLIEKGPGEASILARARATIWASRFGMIRAYFESSTGTPLKRGIKIMCRASVEFHPQYGFSLNITDIDPAYTLGDLSRKKQEVIARLHKEGVMEMNRELNLPPVPQRIAVISSDGAAGYGDFMDSVMNNNQGYVFETRLFKAMMQGDQAPASIISALDRVFEEEEAFDLVVLIRGGGSRADLECFNDYHLAYHITQFPLPVITGIGHERDESVCDLVAWKGLKTPTAVAEFLLDRFLSFEFLLNEYQERLATTLRHLVAGQSIHLERLGSKLIHLSTSLLQRHGNELRRLGEGIKRESLALMSQENKALNSMEERLRLSSRNLLRFKAEQLDNFEARKRLMDPIHVLKRGYSISSLNGKALAGIGEIAPDDKLETRLADGIIHSTVTLTKPNNENGRD